MGSLSRWLYAMVLAVLLVPVASASQYWFIPPIQGEYVEVIAAFIDTETGDYFPPDVQGQMGPDAFIGAILDTGASGNMISVFTQGFSDPWLGDWPGLSLPIKSVNTIVIGGIGSEVGYASVSHPVHVQANSNYFLEQAINENPTEPDVDFTGFPTEENCQMIVGTLDGSPYASADLIGMPFMQNVWTVVYPQERVVGLWNSMLPFDQCTADVRFYERGSSEAPDCSEWIELWYPEGPLHNLDDPGEDPSVGTSPKIDGVRISWDGVTEATARMIVDTGAPLTFVSSEIALAMGLDPDVVGPDDVKQVAGVTGAVVEVPGYWMDHLILTTMDGDELVYGSAMIYILDIFDEQGNIYCDGLIGNNLFHYETDLVGYTTVFFDMEFGYLGLNHPDFTAAPYMPELLANLPDPDVAVVPVPSALLLALTGLGGLFWTRRRTAA